MFEKIVVPLDGSPASEVVLAPLERLIGAGPAELILVHVAGVVPVYPGEILPALQADPGADYLQSLEERFADRIPRMRVVGRIGSSVEGILDVARQERATLIAMATHGRRGLGRLVFGSVTELVLRDSPVPVLAVRIAPDLQARESVESILVPQDGTPESRAALLPAIELARRFDSRLVLFRACASSGELPAAERALQETCGSVVSAGVVAHAFAEEGGEPAAAIVAAAQAHRADLIVMATHGRSGLARLQSGSVTEHVLRETPVPLVAVRAAVVEAPLPTIEAESSR